MRHLTLFLFCCFTVSYLWAQGIVEPVLPFDYSTNFKDIFVDPSGNGWAVGTCGVLARTQNNGQNWDILDAPEGKDYTAVACKPGTNCQTVFLGTNGLVLRSTNGGQSWTRNELDNDAVREFHFLANNVVLFSYSSAGLYRSTNGGDSWTNMPLEDSYNGAAHFPTSTTGYLFQRTGPLLKTTDAGATWDSIYQFENNANYGDWLNENIGFLYDSNRRIFKTSNGGSQWELVTDTGVPSNVRMLAALSETELVAYVFPSGIFRSSDGGVTWASTSTIDIWQTGLTINSIHRQGNNFWLASSAHEILYSTDGLLTTTSQFPDARVSYEAAAFANSEVGYVLQERYGLIKTTDGGDTWTPIVTDFFTVSRNLLVLDAETVIVPYNSSGAQITRNGGQTWSQLLPTAIHDTVYVYDITQLPGGRIYLLGSQHGVYSDHNGQNWQVVYHGLNINPRSFLFINDQTGFAGADGGKMMATTDGGQSWSLVLNGELTNQPISNLVAVDENTVISSSIGNRCSSDGGQTWNVGTCNGVTMIGKVVTAPDGTHYGSNFTTANQKISRSTDGGLSWQEVAQFCNYAVPATITPDGRYLYLVYRGGFLGRLDLDAISTVKTPRQTITGVKAYPNPTNGLLQVDLPGVETTASIALFDLTGKLVQQRQTEASPATLDLYALPAGVYVLRVQGDGWLQTGRVVKQ
jgi:photosystem II stability/assembly factor-like uncharacterized protein